MPFPVGWPPRPCTGRRLIRFFIGGTTTNLFEDHAYLFADQVGANTFTPTPVARPGIQTTGIQSPMGGGRVPENARPDLPPSPPGYVDPHPMLWAHTIRIWNDGVATIQVSFDGTNVHGEVPGGKEWLCRDRYEAGIALRGKAAALVDFRLEAW